MVPIADTTSPPPFVAGEPVPIWHEWDSHFQPCLATYGTVIEANSPNPMGVTQARVPVVRFIDQNGVTREWTRSWGTNFGPFVGDTVIVSFDPLNPMNASIRGGWGSPARQVARIWWIVVPTVVVLYVVASILTGAGH